MTEENHETRLKRLKMRSWRRGMKEMDLILGPFSDKAMSQLSVQDLDVYEEMLSENDQELFSWFSGQYQTPTKFSPIVEHIKAKTSFR